MLSDELIEKYAIRMARANNGGEWNVDYVEEQKQFWRGFARGIVQSIAYDLAVDIAEQPPAKRVETGVIQFGDDWPGVFIRGDNAFAMAMGLAHVMSMAQRVEKAEDIQDILAVSEASGLLELLQQSNVQSSSHKVDRMIPHGGTPEDAS